jgi:Rod binding domain-containing protein
MPPVTMPLSKRLPDASQHDQLITQTQKWVAQTFFGTLLKQVRQSPFHSELFEGGRGGQAFGAMYDQRLAEHMARGAGKKLVNSIVKRIEAKKAYQKSAAKKGESKASHPLSTAPTRSGHVPANLRA